jgi:UDPglucose 6-dehydrogenase
MRIGIIGYGFVGSAVAAAHDRNLLMINDPNKFEDWEQYTVEKIKEHTGWIYLCLPTAQKEDGGCDTSILEDMLEQLKDYEGFVISKSTAPPMWYKSINDQCGPFKKYKFKFIHMPEFLTAKNAIQDYMNPKIIVIGGNPIHTSFVTTHVLGTDLTYKSKAKIVRTDIGSAAAMKYYANSWLATKVVYNNQFAKWCESQNVKWSDVSEILAQDSRLGETHYNVPGENGDVGYGGYCFPKDISAILKIAQDKNVDMSLLETQVEINDALREVQRLEREEANKIKSIPQRRRRDDVPRGTGTQTRRRR